MTVPIGIAITSGAGVTAGYVAGFIRDKNIAAKEAEQEFYDRFGDDSGTVGSRKQQYDAYRHTYTGLVRLKYDFKNFAVKSIYEQRKSV